jgi:2-phosphosulfolactate phosphatase
VIIDILRATSTITTALYNGAAKVIPVLTVPECIEQGQLLNGITAGERDGQIAEGLSYGNSPFEYSREFIEGKTLVLTTTNGTKLLHMALKNGAQEIIIGSFCNLTAVCNYLISQNKNVILGCAAWKDKVNIEDTLFAGAVIDIVKSHFDINCDASKIALNLYKSAEEDLYEFMKINEASHYNRLSGYGLTRDIKYCLTKDSCPIVPKYVEGELLVISY